jgi:hypothetical protein
MSNRAAKHLAALQPGTLFAGVDLSLDDLVVVVLNATADRLDRFRSDNDAEGYATLRQRGSDEGEQKQPRVALAASVTRIGN